MVRIGFDVLQQKPKTGCGRNVSIHKNHQLWWFFSTTFGLGVERQGDRHWKNLLGFLWGRAGCGGGQPACPPCGLSHNDLFFIENKKHRKGFLRCFFYLFSSYSPSFILWFIKFSYIFIIIYLILLILFHVHKLFATFFHKTTTFFHVVFLCRSLYFN